MQINSMGKSTRRNFLRSVAVTAAVAGHLPGWGLRRNASAAAVSEPMLRMQMDTARPLIPVLTWDTERRGHLQANLLRSPGVHLRMRSGTEWIEAAEFPIDVQHLSEGLRYSFSLPPAGKVHWQILSSGGGFTMSFSAEGTGLWREGGGDIQVVFPFDPGVTPTTILASDWDQDGSFPAPLVISAPDFGQMLLTVTPPGQVRGRLVGTRVPHTIDFILHISPLNAGQSLTVSVDPALLQAPAALQDRSMWRLARRGWFNSFQPGAAWGLEREHFRAGIPGVLANNVISDPCSISQFFYADMMLWTPQASGEISIAQLVRRTLDYWLENRTVSTHEAFGYHDFLDFLDANPSLLICAWDYVEATDDLPWLGKRIGALEALAEFIAMRDQDHDGLVEATQSGNAGTLWTNNRSSNWFDAVNFGYKDAYSNALIYRAWSCLADLEGRLSRKAQQMRFTGLAAKLKSAYNNTLLNPRTGRFACWKSDDGQLHDYASPIVNGMAISYGITGPEQGREILNRFWAKLEAVRFDRFDLGIPSTLEPVHRSDYLQPKSNGIPIREDGTDSFQRYQNGGIAAGHSLNFLLANYVAGYGNKADKILQAMLERQQKGLFQNGVQGIYPNGGEWTDWTGKPCGYEGYLADSYYFLLAVVLREPAARSRYLRPMRSG